MAELSREVVATTIQEARSIQSDWQEAVDSLGTDQIDAAPDFLLSILSSVGAGARPYVALERRGTSFSSAIIGRLVKRRISSKIGSLQVPSPKLDSLEIVHGGYLSDGSPESLAWLRKHIQTLLLTGRVECVSVLHLGEEHVGYPQIASGLVPGRRPHATTTQHWLALLVDPETGEKVDRHSSRTRKKFRYYDRKLREHFSDDVVVREVRTPSDLKEFVAVASSIGARSYQKGINVGVQDNARWNTLIETLERQDCLSGHLLVAGGTPIAYALGSIYRSTYSLIATSFLPEFRDLSPGAYLLRSIIGELEERGVKTLDFGFGDAEYKRLYGTVCVPESLMRFYGVSIRARIAEAIDGVASGLTRTLQMLLQDSGFAARIRRMRRRRLEGRG